MFPYDLNGSLLTLIFAERTSVVKENLGDPSKGGNNPQAVIILR